MNQNPQSRVERILHSTLDGTPYNAKPQSRVEEDLLELKALIEAGGGGGGGTKDYNKLDNKPTIDGETLSGDMTNEDLNLVSYKDTTYDSESEHLTIGYQ